MHEQLTVRLPQDLGRALRAASRRMRRGNSEVVRMALRQFLASPTAGRAAQRVRGLIGSLESGLPDLADRHREHVLESLRRGR